jgi:predicted amino acid racemase
MNRVVINLEALYHNLTTVDGWMKSHGAHWSLVTKVLCGHADTLKALHAFGAHSIGESRLENLRAVDKYIPNAETWYLRLPHLSAIEEVVALSDVTLNSETRIIRALDEAAGKQGKIHRIIIMIELGDLREGILPGSLVRFYEQVFELEHIEVRGIGSNLGCLAGALPNEDQFMQLVLYRELLELKFGRMLPTISAGSSVALPMLLEGNLPKAINHFRIGEAVFLGTDLVEGHTLPGLRDDTVVLEAEVIEIKEKNLTPTVETGTHTPFVSDGPDHLSPGQRGYRALVSVGNLETEVAGLTPINPGYQIAGASSDVTVVNVGDDTTGIRVGEMIRFRPNYGALLRLMSGRYVERAVEPPLEAFLESFSPSSRIDIPPVLDEIATDGADTIH